MLLGLNGVVVKSHGGTDAQGFAHALDVAMDMVVHRFNDRIRAGMLEIQNSTEQSSEILQDGSATRLATAE